MKNSLNYVLDTYDLENHRKELIKDLKDGNYIDASTRNMEWAFQNGKIGKKINWIKSRAELKYFIQQLILKGVIDNKSDGIWNVVTICFVVRGKNILSNKLPKDHPPSQKRKDAIDNIIKKYIKYSEAKKKLIPTKLSAIGVLAEKS